MPFITCYHGTSLSRAQDILQNGFRRFGGQNSDENPRELKKPRLWLGTGSYFFQDAPARSREWAAFTAEKRDKSDSQNAKKPAILQVRIARSEVIDLTDAKYWILLKKICGEEDFGELAQNGIDTLLRPVSDQERVRDFDHPIDHVLIDKFVAEVQRLRAAMRLPKKRAVRAAFIEGEPVHPTSWLFDRACIMVNIFDTGGIAKPELVRDVPHGFLRS